MSMEPLRQWLCRGVLEFEAAISQLERDPPSIRDINDNIQEERRTNFSLEGVNFPGKTIDVVKRGAALATFEREEVNYFQQISKAAALYAKALLGGGLESFRELRQSGCCHEWLPMNGSPCRRKRHYHGERNLTATYHCVSPSLSTEEASLMSYLQTPPDAGPTIGQVTMGLRHWRCAGRRSVEIGGRLPKANALQNVLSSKF